MAPGDGQLARDGMVERQLRGRGITDERVLDAMRTVPREAFVPAEKRSLAYEDGPLPIGEGQTISQPYIVARMAEAAALTPEATVLEVGAGSGYAAAVLSRIAGRIVAIERHASLVQGARERIDQLGYEVELRVGDGTKGAPDAAPFDAILVAAGGEAVPPALSAQLAIGGRLIVPVGASGPFAVQRLRKITRTAEDAFEEEDLGGVRFVPLVVGEREGARGA